MSDVKTERDVTFKIQKSRTLGTLLKDTFQFLDREALTLFQAMALYSFLLMFLAMLSAYLFLDTTARFENLFYLENGGSKLRLIIIVLSSIACVVSFCALTLVINVFLLLRQQHPDEPASRIFTELKVSFPVQLKNYALNFLIIYLIYQLLSFGLNYLERVSFFSDYGDLDFSPFNSELNWLVSHLATLVLTPLLAYFCFSSLFLSLRDNIGSSDALKNIYELSKNKLPKLWLYSLSFVFIAFFGEWALHFRSGLYMDLLPYNFHVFFAVITLKKLISFLLLVVLQVGSILLFGSVEEDAKKQV